MKGEYTAKKFQLLSYSNTIKLINMTENTQVTCKICTMYKCWDCTCSTNQIYNSRRHERAFHKNMDTLESEIKKMYKCCYCPFSSIWPSNMIRHKKGMHNKSNAFESDRKKIYKCY